MSKRKTTVAPGKPLNTPDADLDMAALVTADDIEAARADGRVHMTPRGKELLETEKAAEDEGAVGE